MKEDSKHYHPTRTHLKTLKKEINNRGHKDDPTMIALLKLCELQHKRITELERHLNK